MLCIPWLKTGRVTRAVKQIIFQSCRKTERDRGVRLVCRDAEGGGQMKRDREVPRLIP